jgi:hypothetical protein
VSAGSRSWIEDQNRQANAGWIAGFAIIAAVCAVGAVLWFSYHP